MRVRVYPYNMASESATALSRALGGLKARPNGRFRPRHGDAVINWGCSQWPDWWNERGIWLNHPHFVREASDKLAFLQRMVERRYGHIVPDFTTEKEDALLWLEEGHIVVARHLLRGSSGRGIIVYEGGQDHDRLLQERRAPLYTKYIKKHDEYRVHVGRGEPFLVQHKRARRDMPREDRNYRVRHHAGGWVYCVQEVQAPQCVLDVSIPAITQLGLDFGAVDVVYNHQQDRAVVLEVNTACGLSGETTLRGYKDMIEGLVRDRV